MKPNHLLDQTLAAPEVEMRRGGLLSDMESWAKHPRHDIELSNYGGFRPIGKTTITTGRMPTTHEIVLHLMDHRGRISGHRLSRLVYTAFQRPLQRGEMVRYVDDNIDNCTLRNLDLTTDKDAYIAHLVSKAANAPPADPL